MARADTLTLLPLDSFLKNIGVSSFDANQLTIEGLPPLECATTIYQNAWQNPAIAGREDFATALAQAEQDIASWVNYWPAPKYIVGEQKMTVRPADRTLVAAGYGGGFYGYSGGGVNVRGMPKSIQTRYGYYISGGQQAKSLIEADAPIVYTDEDGDGYKETATVIVSTDLTDECEIHAYDPDHSGADSWEIRPITVTLDPLLSTATIVTRREQCVLPAKWDAIDAGQVGPLDAMDDANFLEVLDVYRVYLNPAAPVNFYWANLGCAYCSGSGCAQCTDTVQSGCLNARDNRLGIVTYSPGDWSADSGIFTPSGFCTPGEPDKMRLNYLAGFVSDEACPNQLSPFWIRTISMLAMAYLQGDTCSCTATKTFADWAQTDLALSDGTSEKSYAFANRVLNCPFGTLRGAVEAFARCNQDGVRLPPPLMTA